MGETQEEEKISKENKSSVMEYIAERRVEDVEYLLTNKLPTLEELLADNLIYTPQKDNWGIERNVRITNSSHVELPKPFPEEIPYKTKINKKPLYILKKYDNLIFETKAILARDNDLQHNILHWIIEDFIRTQDPALLSRHESRDPVYLSYVLVRNKKPHFTYRSNGVELPILGAYIKGVNKYINVEHIISDSIHLCTKLLQNHDNETVYKLLISQDNLGNTPLHLLPHKILNNKASQYTEFFEYLLKYISDNFTDEMKVELLCTQNNDGNNILHLLNENPEDHWNEVFDTFGANAFDRATCQFNDKFSQALDLAKTIPYKLLTRDPIQTEESKDEEELSVTSMNDNNIKNNPQNQLSDPSIDELLNFIDNDNNIKSDPLSQHQKYFEQIVQAMNLTPRWNQTTSNSGLNFVFAANDLGNNILHMLKGCHGQLWSDISKTFGSAFLPIDNLNTPQNPEKKSNNEINEENEEKLSKPSGGQPQKNKKKNLRAIKQHLSSKAKSFSTDQLKGLKLSSNDLLVTYPDDDRTIFGIIIENHSLELISYCIENILSPRELYDFYMKNCQKVNDDIQQNPYLSIAEWAKLYNRKTIIIPLVNSLQRSPSSNSSCNHDSDNKSFCNLLTQISKQQPVLDDPAEWLFRTTPISEYQIMHLRIYNLAQAMTFKERKDILLGGFSAHEEEDSFENQDPHLFIEILEHLGLNREDDLTILKQNPSSSSDPKLRPNSNQQFPSVPVLSMNPDYNPNEDPYCNNITIFPSATYPSMNHERQDEEEKSDTSDDASTLCYPTTTATPCNQTTITTATLFQEEEEKETMRNRIGRIFGGRKY